MNKLSINKITKAYGSRVVIQDINYEVNGGEIVSLLGPNGSGKTTSFYIAMGLVLPDRGTVTINGENITKLPIHKRAKYGISYLPQESSIFNGLSVENNILSILEIQKLRRPERQQQLENLLNDFNIKHIRKQLGRVLSGGERRRVEIARALAMKPKFILLDEPFAGIDPIAIIDTKAIIKKLIAKNIGILITDHNVKDTLNISDRTYIINNGGIIAAGTPAEIMKNEIVITQYLGSK